MLHVLVMLHAGEQGLEGLRAFEAQAIPLLREHGGRLLSAFVPEGHQHPDCPDEIHLVELPSREALRRYQQDPRVQALQATRQVALAHSQVYLSQEQVSYP